MRGYLSVAGSDTKRIPVDSSLELYRDPDDRHRIVAKSGEEAWSLDISDMTVSRKKGDEAPVVIKPRSEFIEIHNNGNQNGVVVETEADRMEVADGFVEPITRDATISIGYQTEVHLTVEREARIEHNIRHEGEGDVVMGDQKNVDRRTSIGDDNIINRSDLGGEGVGVDMGEENIVNRSTAGKAPEATDGSDTADTQSTVTPQYCIKCGTELPEGAIACPECGRQIRDPGPEETQQFCARHERMYSGDACPECLNDGP